MTETREAWLHDLATRMQPWFEVEDAATPPVRISVGIPSKGIRSKAIGECWYGENVHDGIPMIFIHPSLSDPVEVGATLLHELVHASLGAGFKHGPVFKRLATSLGLTGRMTATVPTDDLRDRLAAELSFMPPYPHAALNPNLVTTSAGPKQGTRMLKVECPLDGYSVRTTRKWLDVGVPLCPAGHPMEEAA